MLDEMVNWYCLGDVFLFVFKFEIQGMVILEVMVVGLFVVVVCFSGIEDVVCDGYNGFKILEK